MDQIRLKVLTHILTQAVFFTQNEILIIFFANCRIRRIEQKMASWLYFRAYLRIRVIPVTYLWSGDIFLFDL